MSVTNVFVVVLLKPCLSSITNVEYIDIGSEITCSTINNRSPNKTAPRTSDEVVEITISLRKLNNPPKVKIINTTAPNKAVKIWNLILSTLYSIDFLYYSSVTTLTNLSGIVSLLSLIDLRFLNFKYVSRRNLKTTKLIKILVKFVEFKKSCIYENLL